MCLAPLLEQSIPPRPCSCGGSPEGDRKHCTGERTTCRSRCHCERDTPLWNVLVTAVNNWSRHRSTPLGAALAYYSVFSLGPLLLIVISIAGILFGEDAARGSLTAQFRDLLGPAGAQAVEAMLKGASSVTGGSVTAFFGILLLFVAALGVVVQLKDALNTIWDAPEPEGSGFHWYLRTYVISL